MPLSGWCGVTDRAQGDHVPLAGMGRGFGPCGAGRDGVSAVQSATPVVARAGIEPATSWVWTRRATAALPRSVCPGGAGVPCGSEYLWTG